MTLLMYTDTYKKQVNHISNIDSEGQISHPLRRYRSWSGSGSITARLGTAASSGWFTIREAHRTTNAYQSIALWTQTTSDTDIWQACMLLFPTSPSLRFECSFERGFFLQYLIATECATDFWSRSWFQQSTRKRKYNKCDEHDCCHCYLKHARDI